MDFWLINCQFFNLSIETFSRIDKLLKDLKWFVDFFKNTNFKPHDAIVSFDVISSLQGDP